LNHRREVDHKTLARSRQVSRERSKSRDDDVRVTRTAFSGSRKKLSSPPQMTMGHGLK
jgi:hypothetical protein